MAISEGRMIKSGHKQHNAASLYPQKHRLYPQTRHGTGDDNRQVQHPVGISNNECFIKRCTISFPNSWCHMNYHNVESHIEVRIYTVLYWSNIQIRTVLYNGGSWLVDGWVDESVSPNLIHLHGCFDWGFIWVAVMHFLNSIKFYLNLTLFKQKWALCEVLWVTVVHINWSERLYFIGKCLQ